MKEDENNFNLALKHKLPEEFDRQLDNKTPFNPDALAFKKPIYILIDRKCASSCESVVEIFESHPYAKTIGENTGGFVHFGNMGFIVLPYSQIIVQMASDFWRFKDGRYIEFIGHTPEIRVKRNRDALKSAVKELRKNLPARKE